MEGDIRRITRHHLDQVLERVRDGAEFEFVDEFAGLLPMDVICQMLGVPESDRAELRRLADLVVHREEGVYDVPAEGITAALELVQYYSDLVGSRRSAPQDDLTSALVSADVEGDRLTDEEIIAFMFLMVVAGNETTTKLLAHAMFWGARHPDELAKPFSDPARIPDWIEETLRFDTSSQLLARHVTQRPRAPRPRDPGRLPVGGAPRRRPTATHGSSPTRTPSCSTGRRRSAAS